VTRRTYLLFLSTVLALVWAIPSFATSTSLIQFNTVSQYDGVYDGDYAGIYLGTVTQNGQTTQAQFICDDFISEITYGQSWNAYNNTNNPLSQGSQGVRYAPSGQSQYDMSNPNLIQGSGMTLAGVPSSGLSQQQEYNMIAWLVGQLFSDTNNHDGNWASLAGAIWSTADGGWNDGHGGFNSSYLGTNGGTETAQWYLEQALTHQNDNLPNYNVYTPFAAPNCGQPNQPSCNGQEFFSPAPEAATTMLLSLSLLSAGLFRKKLLG